MAMTPEEQQMLVTQQLLKVQREIAEDTTLPKETWELIQRYVRCSIQLSYAQQIHWQRFNYSDPATFPKPNSTLWIQFENGEIVLATFILGPDGRPQLAGNQEAGPLGQPVRQWFYALSVVE